jgi:hypothetical protein
MMRIFCFVSLLWISSAVGDDVIALDTAKFPADMRQDVGQVSAAYRKFPDDASVLYQVAALHARAGHTAAAIQALRNMAETNAGLQPRERDFPSLLRNPEYERISLSIRKKNPPVLRARLAYQLEEGDLVPEGIAWSNTTRKLYLGSVKEKIIALSEDGTVQEFVKPGANGLGTVLGVRVDDQRGDLWAISGSIAAKPTDLVAGIFRFDLRDGSLKKAFVIEGSEKELLNDLVVAKDGSVYVTATNSGTLYRIDAASGKVEKFLPDHSLPDPNGIVTSFDGKYLFISGWYGISRIDLRSRKVDLLDKPANVADGCIDGLYLYGRYELIGIQNCNHEPGRILDFHINFDSRIESARVLESSDPMFDGITTGAIAGDQLYFVANAQFRKLDKDAKPTGSFDALKILRLDLKR